MEAPEMNTFISLLKRSLDPGTEELAGKGMRTLLISRSSAAFLALLGLCLTGCKPESPAAPPPPLVEIATVTQADVPIYHEWIGTLDGLVNAQIRAQVTGYLLKQNYREGDPIKKGDLL